ncbi:MAG: DUF1996 domain-containing protein [Acidimicrobiia bacterium]|nr:DUF1996 domain-containing protein [Acidimicrobiia bacterium]
MFNPAWKLRLFVAATVIVAAFSAITALELLTDGLLIETTTRQQATEKTTSTSPNGDGALQAFGSTTLAPLDPAALARFGSTKSLGDSRSTSTLGPPPADRDTTFESMRNSQDKFSRFADVPSDQLPVADLTEPAPKNDNGDTEEGQFRLACEYSHFSYDDPIIYPGQPGKSHFHMFFGNTLTDAFTTEDSLINGGGGTCQGFELNRSAYWVPALLDGKGNAVVPFNIIIYYKTKDPSSVIAMPQGLQMIGGNDIHNSFETSGSLHWSCGGSGDKYNMTNRIPDCGGDVINASVQFPNCWDGVNLSKPAPDYTSHLTYVSESQPCPSSHPRRLPQISFLIYWEGTPSVDGWYLSSDDLDAPDGVPGGSLHADWWGGWNDETINLWTDGCLKASRNCSFGQTGTPRQLASLNKLEKYEGPTFIPIPG